MLKSTIESVRVLLWAVAFISLHSSGTAATSTKITAPATSPPKSLQKGRLVNIGTGRQMYINCQGTGSPTVVFISGRTDRADIWYSVADSAKSSSSVFQGVSEFTRVCAYDRPGTITVNGKKVEPSRSTVVTQPVSPNDGVQDLHALLTAAEVPGPYVLVGHSYGGLIARLFASIYPKDVAGMVLVDSLTELLYDELTPEQQILWKRLNSNYSAEIDHYTIQEKTDFDSTFAQMHSTNPVNGIPVIILTSDQPYDFNDLISKGVLPAGTPIEFGSTVFRAHLLGQKKLAQMLNAKQINDTDAGHYIQNEQPQMVINAIHEVVNIARKHS